MRALRRFAGCCSAWALIAASGPSSAQLLIVTPEEPEAPIAFAELAYAEGDGPPVTWLSLRIERGPVAIVAALPPQAGVEQGLNAWFSALEASASPNILAPASATRCRDAKSHVHVGWPRDPGTPASELELAAAADVVAALEGQGLRAPAALPEADRYWVWIWAAAEAVKTTRPLRIVGGDAPLALLPSAHFALLVSNVTRGPKRMPAELSNEQLRVSFVAGKDSDYRERALDWLDTERESLLEARVRGPLFDWSILANTVSLPSLVDSYARFAELEQPDLDVGACSRQLMGLRRDGAESAAACGDALDVSLALAAAGAERATLQRWLVSAAAGFAPAALDAGGEPYPPLLRARLLDDTECPDDPPVAIVVDPPARGDGSVIDAGNTTTVVEETTVVVPVGSDSGCSNSRGPGTYYDDRDTTYCSSDTSSSARDEPTCSADSSSSTEDDGCASDSSSSHEGDGCASDSGSSHEDDAACGGGSEDSSYDGDTCTASAAPGAEAEPKARASLSAAPRASRPRKLKLSLWSLAFAAVALPIRRRKRGQNASG